MENNHGLRRFLKLPYLYNILMNMLGAKVASKWMATNFLKITDGDKIIDIGCGPGSFWENYSTLIPQNTNYHGIDPNIDYINRAKKIYGEKGCFHIGNTKDYINSTKFKEADIVMCLGVLHHLTDKDAIELFAFANHNLKFGGRFLAIEPVHLLNQSVLSTWFMNQDRGLYIRSEPEWKNLLEKSKFQFNTNIITGLIRIPYNYMLIEAKIC